MISGSLIPLISACEREQNTILRNKFYSVITSVITCLFGNGKRSYNDHFSIVIQFPVGIDYRNEDLVARNKYRGWK